MIKSLVLCIILILTINFFFISIFIPKKISPLVVFSNENPFNKRTRIIDTWMYNNEAHVAYTRIWRLYQSVDYFLIIVSNYSFTGLSKNISFDPFEKEIEKYRDKIIIYNVNIPQKVCQKTESGSCASSNEESQRDYAIKAAEDLLNVTEYDIFLVSDADEIFTREGVEHIKKNPPFTHYRTPGVMYYPYYFHRVSYWNPCFALRYQKNMTKSITQIRNHYGFSKLNKITDGVVYVTHCSYCFNSFDEYKNKLKTFSHQEYNREPYITNDWIFKSHYCREKINSPLGEDENDTNWRDLIPDDERLKFLRDPSFEYDINLTNYTKNDLDFLCKKKYRRTPYE